MYVSIETQNKMYTYRMEAGRINPEIAFRAETLAAPASVKSRQAAGTVHVHPNGRFLYGANRAQDTEDFQGKKVFKGGENSIVVYAIDHSTGEPDRRGRSLGLTHRRRRQADLRAQVRYRRRQQDDVLDGHGAAVNASISCERRFS